MYNIFEGKGRKQNSIEPPASHRFWYRYTIRMICKCDLDKCQSWSSVSRRSPYMVAIKPAFLEPVYWKNIEKISMSQSAPRKFTTRVIQQETNWNVARSPNQHWTFLELHASDVFRSQLAIEMVSGNSNRTWFPSSGHKRSSESKCVSGPAGVPKWDVNHETSYSPNKFESSFGISILKFIGLFGFAWLLRPPKLTRKVSWFTWFSRFQLENPRVLGWIFRALLHLHHAKQRSPPLGHPNDILQLFSSRVRWFCKELSHLQPQRLMGCTFP